MIPPILKENTVSPFSYWSNGIQQGMRHEGELYALMDCFSAVDRSQAYQKACRLCDRGLKVCLTRSESHYRVWINLKSLTNPQASQPAPQLELVAV